MLSVPLFLFVVLPYRLAAVLGLNVESWPLFVYSKYPFRVMFNDQCDRFSAPIEKRYSASDVAALLQRSGLTDVTVRPCFGWVADGVRPPLP